MSESTAKLATTTGVPSGLVASPPTSIPIPAHFNEVEDAVGVTTAYHANAGQFKVPYHANGAPYISGTTGTIASANAQTSFTIALATLGITSLLDLKAMTLVIANNGTGQSINKSTLRYTDTIGGQVVNIDYPIPDIFATDVYGTPGVFIASGANLQTVLNFDQGILNKMQLIITFVTAPVAGSVSVQGVLHSKRFVGALFPRLLVDIPYTVLNSTLNFVGLGVLRRGAVSRTFTVLNSTDQVTGSMYINFYESQTFNTSYSLPTSVETFTSIGSKNYAFYTDGLNSIDNTHGAGQVIDSAKIALSPGATAATSGNVQIWVTEVLG